MTSLTTTPEETWVSDFGPVPFDSLDPTNQRYEVRSYWLADFKLKAITEVLAFTARFESPEVFSAYLDIKGDEGYVTFEIKGNTRPQTISLRYMADRWSAVDGRGAHTISKNGSSETTVKSRGEITIFHAFLDAMLIEKVCNQLDINAESQATLFTRINFKEKTFSLVAPENALNDFPALKPYKTSIIPKSPSKTGESMNAQEEKADATSAHTASVEPYTEPTASSVTDPDEAAKIELARAEVVAWAASAEAAAAQENSQSASTSTVETKDSDEAAPAIEAATPVEAAPPEQVVQTEDSQVVSAAPVQAEVPVESEAAEQSSPAAETATPETNASVEADVQSALPVEATSEEASISVEAAPEQATAQAETATPVETTSQADAPADVATPVEAAAPAESAPEQANVSTAAAPSVESSATEQVNVKAEASTALETATPAQTKPVEAKEKSNAEFFTPQKNAAKSSDAGVLGKLAVKNNEEKSNRDQSGRDNSGRNSGRDNSGRDKSGRDSAGREASARDNSGRDKSGRENSNRDNAGREASARDNSGRDNSARTSNSTPGRTNFAPQNNRSIEAPRPIESTPKYHTYSQSEVDSLIKKSADNVAASVTSKINKQTKTVEDTLKNQDFAFKQALEQINKQSEVANQKLDKAVVELTLASSKQKDEYKDAFSKQIEEFKSQMNQKVNQGVKVIDTKLEQLAEVKIPKQKQQSPAPVQSPKASAKSGGLSVDTKIAMVVGGVLFVVLVNGIIMFGISDRLAKLENALGSASTSTSTSSEVPIPDLMKDQINKEKGAAPTPVRP